MAGTGIFANLGIDVAALVNEHVSPSLLDVTIHKAGAAASRTPGSLTSAPAKADTEYPARGMVESLSPKSFSDSGLKLGDGDKKVLIVGDSAPSSLNLASVGRDDVIEIEGAKYAVSRLIERDPAGATYVYQVKDV